MRKKTKALSGASQDAYFRRVLKAHPSLSVEERDKLVGRLRAEIAQLRMRVALYGESDVAPRPTQEAKGLMVAAAPTLGSIASAAQVLAARAPAASPPAEQPQSTPASPAAAFDPYTPNVIVVVRKSGRAAALAALDVIDSLDDLRLLAREQRLSIAAGLQDPVEVRAAIVAAAERRIANRMAAAS
jgi:hypothetical protein